MLDATTGSPLPAACFDDPAQQGQITLANGYYKFDVNFSDPACPSGGDYVIGVTVPATGFTSLAVWRFSHAAARTTRDPIRDGRGGRLDW